jgi:hypothetical protein
MAITTFSNTVSISTTEISLLNGNSTIASNSTSGVYQLFLDLNALAVGDQFQLKIYEKVANTSSTQRVIQDILFTGVQGNPATVIPSFVLTNGWDYSLKKISGTDRSVSWSIRTVA